MSSRRDTGAAKVAKSQRKAGKGSKVTIDKRAARSKLTLQAAEVSCRIRHHHERSKSATDQNRRSNPHSSE
jgi:hypothetical protein